MISSIHALYVDADESIFNGEPIVKGTRTPVRAIVELYRMGVLPEEIPAHLPHLKLSQVFGALSYYSDNTDEINGYITRNRIDDLSTIALDE